MNIIQNESLKQTDQDILLDYFLEKDIFPVYRYICIDDKKLNECVHFIQNEIWSKCQIHLSNFEFSEKQNEFLIYKRKKSIRVGFEYFWTSFFSFSERLYLNHLLDLIENSILERDLQKCDVIYHSHFGNPGYINPKHKNQIKYIFYSGEKYGFAKEIYNLSLCHEEENKNIICYPLFFFLFNADPKKYHLVYDKNESIDIPSLFCAFIVGNPNCRIRNLFFMFLSQYKHINSYGNVFNNVGYKLDFPYTDQRQLELLGRHKFVICFENTKTENYYITEKLMIAKASGTIPIYWGSKKCQELFNKNAFLYLEDESENGMMNLLQKIKLLDSNDKLYLMMRNTPLISDDIKNKFSKETIQNKIYSIMN
jgi:hypothetical protein